MLAGSAALLGLLVWEAYSSPTRTTQDLLSRALTDNPPTVALDSATVTGVNNETFIKFLGIPFAEPPYIGLPYHLHCQY